MNNTRSWCFTLNNYTDEEVQKLKDVSQFPEGTYLVGGYERGKTGTPHIQGYVRFPNAKTLEAAKGFISNRAHMERAKGNPSHNFTYCTKEGDHFSHGKFPQQGKRSDIDSVRAALEAGATMRQVLNTVTSYQCARFGELWLKYKEEQRSEKPKVYWFWGATGTGKSKSAAERWPDAYYVSNGKWWCGYDGHEEVIWDDFRPDQIKFREILRITDRYPMRVECKGGQRQLMFHTIVFTSPKHPKDVYDKTEEDMKQLLRRIDVVEHFN